MTAKATKATEATKAVLPPANPVPLPHADDVFFGLRPTPTPTKSTGKSDDNPFGNGGGGGVDDNPFASDTADAVNPFVSYLLDLLLSSTHNNGDRCRNSFPYCPSLVTCLICCRPRRRAK